MNKSLTRREALGVLGASLVLSACGSGSSVTGSSVASTSGKSAATMATQPATTELPDEVEVKVVDYIKQSYQGYDFNDYWMQVDYEYDEAGRLVQAVRSDPFGIATEYDFPGWKYVYEYDASNRLTDVSWYAEYIDWGLSYTETFTYNEDGTCATYCGTIQSQGYGDDTYSYTYDEDGLITSAVATIHADDVTSVDFAWAYDANGVLTKVTQLDSNLSVYGIGLDEMLSNIDAGVLVYKTTRDIVSTLRFDEDGNLTTVEAPHLSIGATKEYVYKTITVKRSEWVPSVYSNPSGLDNFFTPQVSAVRKARLLGE